MAALVLIGFLWAQASPPAALTTERLPGFQLDLPREGTRRADAADYGSGKLLFSSPGKDLVVQVKWRPGTAAGAAFGSEMNGGMAAQLTSAGMSEVERDTTVVVPGSRLHQSWKGRMDAQHLMRATSLICGVRTVNILSASSHPGIESFHGRMMRSFRCRPERAKEEAIARALMPLAVDLPPAWKRGEAVGPDQLVLTRGPSSFSVTNLGAEIDEKAVADVLPRMVGPNVRLGERQGADWAIEDRGEGSVGWVRFLPCPERKQSALIVVLVKGDPRPAETARQLLGKARCRQPDEPAPRREPRPGN